MKRKKQKTKDRLFWGKHRAAAAIKAAVKDETGKVSAVVSRGGRVDLADKELAELKTPTLLIVGENDDFVVDINKYALKKISCTKEISVIPKATHLFEEEGAWKKLQNRQRNGF